nr:TetR/AcrR family transcriptional regulator [Clostridium botulinum]
MEDKKTLIYDCAKEIFAIKGFKDTNISDIAKMAGMAVGTFYNYYPSKENFLWTFIWKKTQSLKRAVCSQLI